MLRWADTAQERLFDTEALPSEARNGLISACLNSVMRANLFTMMVPHEELKALKLKAVRTRPRLVRVGRTSWTVRTAVTTCDGALIAMVETVMVHVDSGLTKPEPLPYQDELNQLLTHPSQAAAVCEPGLPKQRPRDPAAPAVFTWETNVRATDCDGLDHINNALYLLLAEEARAIAHHHLPEECGGEAMAQCGARWASVEYTGQAHPFETLCIAVWFDRSQLVYHFEMRVGEQQVASVSIGLRECEPEASNL